MRPFEPDREFSLDKLRLENYRCFPELYLDFDKNLTVFVAPNGGGKTAVLDAVAIALRLFVDTMEGRSTSKGFDSKDIRLVLAPSNLMEPATPVRFMAEGRILGERIKWARERHSISASRTTTAEAQQLKEVAILMSFMHQKWSRVQDIKWKDVENMPLSPIFPIISYYGTGRLWSASKLTETKRAKLSAPNARYRGYTDCLSSSSQYKYFIDWFRRYSYEAKREESRSVHKPQLFLHAVRTAVDIVLQPSGWSGLEWDFAEDIIVANHPIHGRLPVDVLSDGIRNVIGLVADVSHRMARLNPQLEERVTSQTPGIVLIDEVDMHLHPEWQQAILRSLKDAFPKVQFIVTTHSPQVLSTVKKENVRMLLSDPTGQDWKSTEPPKSPLGQESGDALANIMGTHPRPDLPQVLEHVYRYEQLVRAGHGDSPEAALLLEKLQSLGFEFRDSDLALFNFLKRKTSGSGNQSQ